MAHAYLAVLWNSQKKKYDLILWAGIVLYLAVFIVVGALLHPSATAETLLIRGLATAAFLLLHIILVIGPLARLNSRFLPLLYNRRHMGVSMFVLALGHGLFSLVQFHALGNVNPLISLLAGNTQYGDLSTFPFQPLGFAALIILLFMAATSHDFWLTNLTPPTWKALHMMVYVAYGLIVLHVAFGVLQAETNPVFVVLMAIGFASVIGLHLIAGFREKTGDRAPTSEVDGWIDVCAVTEIPEKYAHVAVVGGERVAIFKYDGKLSAVSNVCRHQNGPLGEGKIIDGCITCPWHGYQYKPEDGTSPPPFSEKVATFRLKLSGGRVYVHPKANPAGTYVKPVALHDTRSE